MPKVRDPEACNGGADQVVIARSAAFGRERSVSERGDP